MKALNELLSGLPTYALGWTLLHSLWQALLAAFIVLIVFRLVPRRHARARYAVALGGLLATCMMSAVTFISLLPAQPVSPAATVYLVLPAGQAVPAVSASGHSSSFISSLTGFIQSNMTWIVNLWFTGAILLSLKILAGYWYVTRLKSTAVPVENEWRIKLSALARQLGITRAVRLAGSGRITTPVVIGYLKPVVLVPIGMFTGLTAGQVETILLHELTHIRRHDYLVNMVQLVIETVYFFNPFVWLLSAAIRREREYCCDDDVVTQHGCAITYARALARLEEARLHPATLALAAADNKFELLTRIKRIMETPVKNHAVRERILPFALIALMLVCASWLSFSPGAAPAKCCQKDKTTVASDTSKNKRERSARYSRSTIVTLGEDGKPHEEIVEEFEGDDELRPAVEAHASVMPPSFPGFDQFNNFDMQIPPVPAIGFITDTFPRSKEWEMYSKAFEKMLREKFGDFYQSHQQDIDKMMEELNEQFSQEHSYFNDEGRDEHISEQMERAREMMEKHEEMLQKQHLEVEKIHREQQVRMIELQEKMNAMHQQFETGHMERMHKQMKALEDKMHRQTTRLREELVRDGYIEAGEEISELSWNSDTPQLKVNGKKIKLKEKDKNKYKELLEEWGD